MNIQTIDNTLKAHGIQTKIIDNKLFALDEYTKEGILYGDWVNATGWSKKKLLHWLGY